MHDVVEQLTRKKPEFVPHLAALGRLLAFDIAQQGDDPMPFLVEQVHLCFDGRLPLDYAGRMLGELSRDVWSPGRRCRFQALVCERAFSAGLEVSDLLELGRLSPALGSVLALEDGNVLAQRRLLWSQRGTRPWGRAGHARTVFELAAEPDAGGEILARFPDLLLAVRGFPILVCGRGVWFADVWLTRMPRVFEVLTRRAYDEPGFNLVIDSHRFNYVDHPGELAEQIERWCRYYFREFLPQAGGLVAGRAADVIRRLMTRNGVPCSECRKLVIPRRGDVGLTLEAKAADNAAWVTAEVVT
jgi:hypothetical protein